ncbi:glycosyltransferase family 4 protein [Candidatus Gottesmanbacteria bacterium]|nr:glycosyltransferase family 4 protein [Candidatus Gottesmanbacteria bacterium]
MKIAIDISQLVYKGTGVATYTDQLVRNLLKSDTKNEYILFGISLRKFNFFKDYIDQLKASYQNVEGRFFHIPPRIGEFIWNKLHLINIETFIDDIDIFYSSDWIQPPTKAKKITTVHDLLVYKYPDVSHPYIVQVQKRRLELVKKECDMVVADSNSTKRELIDILHFNKDKIEVIYPGISEKFIPEPSDKIQKIRQKYGLYDDYILSVGTIEPRKNLKGIISAFELFLKHSLIASRKNPVELVLVGKFGWGEKWKPRNKIKSLGYVSKDDLPSLYTGASMFLYPSFYEGFGFPVLEAMACGCPVITSNQGSLSEVVADAALIVDPQIIEDISSKMIQLFVDNSLRKEFITKGKENVYRFNWDKTAKSFLNIYKNLYK